VIVVDASVVVKLFRTEADSELARAFFDWFLDAGVEAVAPSVVTYEVLSAALHVNYPFDTAFKILSDLRSLGLSVEDPTRDDIALAEKIATTRAPGGGYPTLFDSIYHAMAIGRGGTFLTADEKHIRLTENHGHVTRLSDWRPA